LTNSSVKPGDEVDAITEVIADLICSGIVFDEMCQIVRLQSAHLSGYNAAISSSLRDGPIRGPALMFSSSGFDGKKVLLIHVRELLIFALRFFAETLSRGQKILQCTPNILLVSSVSYQRRPESQHA